MESNENKTNYFNEYIEAGRKAKRLDQQAQSQFIHDRDIIRDLKQQCDQLDLAVIAYRRQNEECQKTQMIFNQKQCDKEEKYLNDILQLQAKNKDLENAVCKIGKSTKTLRLLTNEQKAFRDNLCKSGLGYNGPYVLSQAYAKIPKLYRAYELCDENEQLHVFDSEDTHEDAKKSRLKMNEFQKDEKVQELKIKPIDYGKLNKLYDDFVPQKELSAEQKYFPSSFISSEDFPSETKPSMASMPMENDLDEILKQNELLKDRLLEASLAEDVMNLVITSCVEIRNKDLQDETERISKESKDVSNERKTVDTFCNDACDVTQELSKRIHKSRENNSLKTLQKENENILASLQIENDHLKQTYKDLFESVQRSKVETNQCDEVKVNVNFDEIETQNIELEHQVASLLKENDQLKLVYKNLFESIKKPLFQKENLRATLSEFSVNYIFRKEYSSTSSINELEKESGENICDNAKCECEIAKFEVYFEKPEKTKVVPEQQLARKVDDSKAENDQFLKEMNHLITQLENLKGKSVETKLDKSLIFGKPPSDKLLINSRISKSWFTPKVDVQKNFSKPVTA
ncbi:hypothetical protein Tco_1235628 [Tanacetum coccineum]